MKKILFLDRDGTLLTEPADQQIDRLDKFALEPEVVPALRRLRDAGYTFVMVTNQDGLGTPAFPEARFAPLQALLLRLLASQGLAFEAAAVELASPKEHPLPQLGQHGVDADIRGEGGSSVAVEHGEQVTPAVRHTGEPDALMDSAVFDAAFTGPHRTARK